MNQSKITLFLESIFSWPVLISIVFFVGFQLYFPSNPSKPLEIPFLNRDVVFDSHKHGVEEPTVFVETELCEYAFSSKGAVLVGVVYKKHLGKDSVPLRTVHERGQFEKDQDLFLLALEDKTPLNYRISHEETLAGKSEISFEAVTADKQWKITKTFIVQDDSYRVDVKLSFEPLKDEVSPLSPRLFVSGPFLPELDKDKLEGVVMLDDNEKLERLPAGKNEAILFWNAPRIAAVEDKYFVHALIGYESGFLSRVFYKRAQGFAAGDAAKKGSLSAGLLLICECAKITEKSDVVTSWYLGPKSLQAMEKVDVRLTSFLSLGWISSLSRLFLWAIEVLYEYFGNYGFVIIILTLLLKILLMPLFILAKRETAKSTAFETSYAADLHAIKQKHKDDYVTRESELSKFYDAHNVSKNGGVLTIVSSIVFFLLFSTLYGLMNNSLALYYAPFAGWIINLGAPDPYYVLPLLLILGFVFQQRNVQMSFMGGLMMRVVLPVAMFAFGMNFPAGILIYMATNALTMIFEDFLIKKVFPV